MLKCEDFRGSGEGVLRILKATKGCRQLASEVNLSRFPYCDFGFFAIAYSRTLTNQIINRVERWGNDKKRLVMPTFRHKVMEKRENIARLTQNCPRFDIAVQKHFENIFRRRTFVTVALATFWNLLSNSSGKTKKSLEDEKQRCCATVYVWCLLWLTCFRMNWNTINYLGKQWWWKQNSP
jgi:hypothetical protein